MKRELQLEIEKTLHVIVENEASVLYFQENHKLVQKIVWHTTSPWLLEKLSSLNEEVKSLEEGVSFDSRKKLGAMSIEFSDQMMVFLDKVCKNDFDGYLVGRVLRRALLQRSYLFLYKSFLLKKWYKKYNVKESKLIVVGDPTVSFSSDFSLNLGRHDALFAKLSFDSGLKCVDIITYRTECNAPYVSQYDKSLMKYERPLTIFSHKPSGFFLLLWLSLNRRGFLNSKAIKLFRKEKAIVYFFKNCESLHEIFLNLLLRGVKIVNYMEDFHVKNNITLQLGFKKERLLGASHRVMRAVYDEACLSYDAVDSSAVKILSDAIYKALGYGKGLLNKFDDLYQKLDAHGDAPKAIVTNHLASPQQKLLQQFLIGKSFSFFNFQHGVTAGIDGIRSSLESKNFSSYGKDFWCCYSLPALNIHAADEDTKGGVVVGAPDSSKKVLFRKVFRMLMRRVLRLKLNDRLVMYFTCFPRNNDVGLPSQNDLEYFVITKEIAINIFSRISDKCIVKLYPLTSSCYQDQKSFLENINLPKNVSLLREVGFKYLRALPDVLILNYSGSVLGDAWSTGKPLIFIEFPSIPLTDEIREQMKEAVFLVDGSLKSWVTEVNALLKLPHERLLKLWNEKANSREKLERHFMFGPKGNMAKKASKYIVDTILSFH